MYRFKNLRFEISNLKSQISNLCRGMFPAACCECQPMATTSHTPQLAAGRLILWNSVILYIMSIPVNSSSHHRGVQEHRGPHDLEYAACSRPSLLRPKLERCFSPAGVFGERADVRADGRAQGREVVAAFEAGDDAPAARLARPGLGRARERDEVLVF